MNNIEIIATAVFGVATLLAFCRVLSHIDRITSNEEKQ